MHGGYMECLYVCLLNVFISNQYLAYFCHFLIETFSSLKSLTCFSSSLNPAVSLSVLTLLHYRLILGFLFDVDYKQQMSENKSKTF